jgi:hypothetical protein
MPLRPGLFGLVLAVGLVCAQTDDAPPVEVPQVGRPDNFSGASGSFRVEAAIEPDSTHVEEPVWLTFRVIAVGPVAFPPERIPLEQCEELQAAFFIEEVRPRVPSPVSRAVAVLGQPTSSPSVATLAVTAGLSQETSWEFVWKLRPRHERVTEVPGLPFAFHNPRILSAERSFQTQYTDSLPLRVLPPEVFEVPIQAGERFFAPGQGDPLVQQVRRGLSVPLLLALALLPLFGCVIWYAWWRRLYPDAARLAQKRRSRAARQALAALERVPQTPAEKQAELVATAVTTYLHQRLDLPVAEPTPLETAGWLERLGCNPVSAGRAREFLKACDAARFQPTPSAPGRELTRAAGELILALEEESCATHG